MKRVLKRLPVGGLALCPNGFGAVERACRLSGLAHPFRATRWNAGLAELGEEKIILPWVTLYNPSHVRIGTFRSVAEFVHLWGGGRHHHGT